MHAIVLSEFAERVDLPADWTVDDFLSHHRYFYNDYDREIEAQLLAALEIDSGACLSSLSPASIRWMHVTAALSRKPTVLVLDLPTLDLGAKREQRILDYLSTQVFSQKVSVFVSPSALTGPAALRPRDLAA